MGNDLCVCVWGGGGVYVVGGGGVVCVVGGWVGCEIQLSVSVLSICREIDALPYIKGLFHHSMQQLEIILVIKTISKFN